MKVSAEPFISTFQSVNITLFRGNQQIAVDARITRKMAAMRFVIRHTDQSAR